MKDLSKLHHKIQQAENKLNSAIGNLEKEIDDKVEFEFNIVNVAGDGFCILNAENSDISMLTPCLEVIIKKGVLTLDDFNNYKI